MASLYGKYWHYGLRGRDSQIWDDVERNGTVYSSDDLGRVLLVKCDGMTYDEIHPNIQTVKRCILYGANLSVVDDKGRTALHLAARYGHIAVVLHLLRAGADPRHRDKEQNTFLHHLVRFEEGTRILSEVVRTYKLDLEVKNKCESTVLYHAMNYGRAAVPILFRLGARFDLDSFYCGCIHCYYGNPQGKCYGANVHVRWVIVMWLRKILPWELIRLVCIRATNITS